MADRTVAAWYGELRGGSPITWAEHLAAGSSGAGTPVCVGAAHLELVRRLAVCIGDRADFADLADRVVATPAFGRGRVDIPLPVPGPAPASGSPPIDPELVPAGELLRIAVPVLAGLLGDGGPGAGLETPASAARSERVSATKPRSSTGGRRWGRHPRVVVHGNPGVARPVREALAAAGVRQGGRSALHVVLAAPLEAAVLALWGARVTGGAAVRWRRFWQRLAAGAELPPAIDPGGILDELAARIRRDRIHLVVADSPAVAAARVGALVGLDLRAGEGLAWAEADLARRLNWFNAARMDPARRAAEVGLLLDLLHRHPLAEEGGSGAGALVGHTEPARFSKPGVPATLRPWAKATALGVRDGLAGRVRTGGYAVHGDLEEVGEVVNARRRTSPAATLDVATEAITRAFVGRR